MSTCAKPPQVICPPRDCPPPPQDPPCLPKPVMRGLHLAQTKRVLAQAIVLSILSGAAVYFFVGLPRRRRYREYYEKTEFELLADEMARKGLFQAVPIPPED